MSRTHSEQHLTGGTTQYCCRKSCRTLATRGHSRGGISLFLCLLGVSGGATLVACCCLPKNNAAGEHKTASEDVDVVGSRRGGRRGSAGRVCGVVREGRGGVSSGCRRVDGRGGRVAGIRQVRDSDKVKVNLYFDDRGLVRDGESTLED